MRTPSPRRPLAASLALPSLALAATAATALLLTGCSSDGRGPLVALFGPPSITLTEAYPENPSEPRVDHSAFTALLQKHVDDNGGVDYAGVARDAEALDGYLQTIATADFEALGRDEKLALLLNAYNAATLKLITEHLGVASIKDIPSDQRWTDERWVVGGKTMSLTAIENQAIRPNFLDSRIHWALVCAAVSCPPLRREAYTGARLEAQLAEQTRITFTRGTRWLRVDDGGETLRVSPILLWYLGDFVQTDGSVAEHVATVDAGVRASVAAGDPPRVDYQDYDWSLNTPEAMAAAVALESR